MKCINEVKSILDNFQVDGDFFYYEPFGCGHINSTYAVYYKHETRPPKRYILQKINHTVFKEPDKLMENVVGVTSFLKKKIIENGGDPERETLNIVYTTDNNPFYIDEKGEYWRMYVFVENATSFQSAEKPELFMASARAFGKFQKLLADYPADTLHETIENFHNTADRYRQFEEAVEADVAGRKNSVLKEIEFAKARKEDTTVIVNLLNEGKLPLRVTHNDTKLNNVMLDNDTEEDLCVIDLDTVMPGSSLYDFGDSIRFGASTAAEDEKDLSKVEISLELFDMYSKGYLNETKNSLTELEKEYLPFGSKLMTYECGIRFLTDYLNGDTYFKIHYPDQNLDRCRTQFKLVEDMESKMEEMKNIVKKYS